MDLIESLRRLSAIKGRPFTVGERAEAAIAMSEAADALEALRALLPFAEHADNCGDDDAYNNAEVPSCGCGLDGIREHADALLREQKVEVTP